MRFSSPIKVFTILALLVVCVANSSHANAIGSSRNSFEYAHPDATLRFNGITGCFEYAHPDATLKFNGLTGSFEYAHPDATPKFNGITGCFEYAHPDATLRFNGLGCPPGESRSKSIFNNGLSGGLGSCW